MTQRIALAALLMGAVLWLTPRIFPVPPASPVVRDSMRLAGDTTPPSQPALPAPAPTTAGLPTTALTTAPPVAAETTVVDRGLSRLRFSSHGAALVGVALREHRSLRPRDKSNVELARPGEALLTYRLVTAARDTVRLDSVSFGSRTTTATAGAPVVEYQAATRAGEVLLRYAVSPDSYVVRVTGEVRGAAPGAVLLVTLPRALHSAEADTMEDRTHLAIAYKPKREGATGVGFGSMDAGEKKIARGPLTWAVTKNKYFLVAVAAPIGGAEFGDLEITGDPRTAKEATHMTGVLQVPVRDGAFALDVYAGPQEWRRLLAMGRDLDNANPYGGFFQDIVQPFATFVMRALLWMHEALNLSYGWVLVLFGVLVRVVTWPLNQKAMRTSLRMQRIQPEMAELQKRFKKDPQKLNEEMMKLYRSHGMSPFSSLAGCMPMLIPMPVLFALFFVFQNTIEFRGVPFLWLPDISLYDPLYVLPLLMGLSMFALSWIGLRNAPPNPQAKMMAYIMPVVMTAIFFRFPSGLNLYYTVQNIVTLPQQWLLTKERAKMTAGAAPPKAVARRRPAT